MSKLKPCPFCGAPGVIIENKGRRRDEHKKYHAACNNPKCGLYGGLMKWYSDKSDAIVTWNCRAENTGT